MRDIEKDKVMNRQTNCLISNGLVIVHESQRIGAELTDTV